MVYITTLAGIVHTVSEDAVLVGSEVLSETSGAMAMPESGFICVADGVGGNRGGAEASRFILSELAAWREQTAPDLKAFLQSVNERLICTAAEEGVAPEMASTLTGICITNGCYRIVHVGNTRAYVKQGNYLKQITADHTAYNWLMSMGEAEAAERCNKNEITNCFGGGNPALLARLFVADCQQFSLALLTSDGIHEYVDLDTLEEIIAGEGSYAEKCEEIVRRAIEAGSQDDLSVVIVCPFEQ